MIKQELLHTNRNQTGVNAPLYNETYNKVVDDLLIILIYRNKTEVRHVSGTNYTDVLITCLLDYGEPAGQDAFDTASQQMIYLYLTS